MSSDSEASGLSLAACCGGRPRGGSWLAGPVSARFSRSESHPSRPWSALAGETGGASVRREAGMPRSGGGKFEALPLSRGRGAGRDDCTSLRPLAVASIGSSSRCTLARPVLTTSSPRP